MPASANRFEKNKKQLASPIELTTRPNRARCRHVRAGSSHASSLLDLGVASLLSAGFGRGRPPRRGIWVRPRATAVGEEGTEPSPWWRTPQGREPPPLEREGGAAGRSRPGSGQPSPGSSRPPPLPPRYYWRRRWASTASTPLHPTAHTAASLGRAACHREAPQCKPPPVEGGQGG
jgi:hypothetical protein